MGKNFIMNIDGYQTLFPDTELTDDWGISCYQLEDDSDIGQIIDEMKEKYHEGEQFEMEATYDSDTGGLSVITEGIHGLTLLVYVLGVIFVIVTVGIVCNKMIAKERKDYGIYKSMGFTSMNIRLLLSLRFAVASLIGALVGILLDVVLSQSISNVIFGYFGIYHYDSERLFRVMAIPVLFMVVIFTVFAFLKAGKVKKCDVNVLIVE